MKKKQYSTLVTIIKNIFNVRAWFDYDRMRSFTLYLYNGAKKMLIPQSRPLKNEILSRKAFQEQMIRLNLTEAEIVAREKGLYRLCWLMIVFALGMGVYLIYHIIHGAIPGILISSVLVLISLVLAFRYHFWYYQFKVRKLGCTIQEWYKRGLLGEKNE